jgi:hypothetical protein
VHLFTIHIVVRAVITGLADPASYWDSEDPGGRGPDSSGRSAHFAMGGGFDDRGPDGVVHKRSTSRDVVKPQVDALQRLVRVAPVL